MTNSSKLYITEFSQNRWSIKVCPNPGPKKASGTCHREQKRPNHIGRSDWVKMTHTGTKKGISHKPVFWLCRVIKPSHKNVVMPTCLTDCPCDLLIVIANANFTWNWRHLKINGNYAEEGSNEMLGMKTSCPTWGLANNHAYMIFPHSIKVPNMCKMNTQI
jgi:hypothetical protein